MHAVIRAALPSYNETEVAEKTNKKGLRGKLNKVVLAYSGGLDTSVIVPWLRYDLCSYKHLDLVVNISHVFDTLHKCLKFSTTNFFCFCVTM